MELFLAEGDGCAVHDSQLPAEHILKGEGVVTGRHPGDGPGFPVVDAIHLGWLFEHQHRR